MREPFNIGDSVEWKHVNSKGCKIHRGIIVEIIPAFKKPGTLIPEGHRFAESQMGRKSRCHESYLIKENGSNVLKHPYVCSLVHVKVDYA